MVHVMATDSVGAPTGVPPTLFAQTRGARIAYQDFGLESPVVVAIPPTAQNVEVSWEWPDVRVMLERFGSFSRWIHFDKRGTGASDRRSRMPGIDERVEDLRAVMDAAGVDQAFLYGASEGGPTCLLFAVTYPERVQGIILHGSGAYTERPDQTLEVRDARRLRYAAVADIWGTPESPMVDHFAPSLAHDDAFRRWHQRYERLASDRESLIELYDISLDVDVREVLPNLKVPTLLLHRKDDPIIPLSYAQEVAAAVPGAELVELEGNDHFAYAGDQSWLDVLERFVTGTVRPSPLVNPQRSKARIQTMGRFTVSVSGADVPIAEWGSRKARQLCKRLVAARGWPVVRDELCELLWPGEVDIDRLGARLSVQLSHVRRVLGGGVVADRQTVALNLDEVATDLEEIMTATDDRVVVDTYAGDFLPENVYDDWTRGPRDEARARFVASAVRLGVQAVEVSDWDLAALLSRKLLDADRYDDKGYRLAIAACRGLGDASGVRRLHQQWSNALSEMGIDVPDLETLDERS